MSSTVAESKIGSGATLALLAGLIVAWFVLIQQFGEGNIYAILGPFACIATAVSIALYPSAMAEWLRPNVRAIAIGVGVGAAMVALTYPVFQAAASLVPGLDSQVESLYSGARSTTLPFALAWTTAIIVAEELLFRGAWLAALRNWLPARGAYAVSLVFYTLAQYGTGSWIVMAMAFVCGVVWSAQRAYTGTLVSPLVAHLIWSPTVILLYPVT